jgi:ribonuclease HI
MWAKRLWKNNTMSELVNTLQELYLKSTNLNLNTQFCHVQGHTGIYGNTIADSYATSAVQVYMKKR